MSLLRRGQKRSDCIPNGHNKTPFFMEFKYNLGPEGFEHTTKGLWVPCATAAPQARDDLLFLFNFQFALAFGLAVARALSFPSTSKDYQSFSWSPCHRPVTTYCFIQFSSANYVLYNPIHYKLKYHSHKRKSSIKKSASPKRKCRFYYYDLA